MPTLTLLRLTLLHRYCADGYADGLCKQSQALACAADLLEKHAFDSYEAHVALRTVRTVDAIERVLPSSRVDWGFKASPTFSLTLTPTPTPTPTLTLTLTLTLTRHAFDSYEAHVALRTVRLGLAVWPELVRVRARTRLITVCVPPSD